MIRILVDTSVQKPDLTRVSAAMRAYSQVQPEPKPGRALQRHLLQFGDAAGRFRTRWKKFLHKREALQVHPDVESFWNQCSSRQRRNASRARCNMTKRCEGLI
jgi:hypothetical protein